MRTELFDSEIKTFALDAKHYLKQKYPRGVKRETLVKKAKYYQDFYEKHYGNKANEKSKEGFHAMWVLLISDKHFIKAEDIGDKEIEEYISQNNRLTNGSSLNKNKPNTNKKDDKEEMIDIQDEYYNY